jgi:hypothetical protein
MPPTRVRRIGYLFAGTRAVGQRWADAFADQLRTLGWIEGENLIVEWRFPRATTKFCLKWWPN